MCVRNGAVVHAWCLMSNHYHLLLVQAQLSPDLIFAATGIPFALGTNALNTIFTDPYGRSTNRETTVVVAPKAYQYDANGNLTNDGRMAYFWNDENRLVAVRNAKTGTLIQENRYDGLGRRRERIQPAGSGGVDPGSTNRYLYQDWLVLAVTDGEGNVLETYTHGADLSGQVGGGAGGIGGILASTQASGPAYYHYDFNGNVVNVGASNQTQQAKYTYGPFGEVLLKEGEFDCRYQFSTKELDGSTGMNYYGFRYLSPELGRWVNRDPIYEQGSISFMFWYNYVKENLEAEMNISFREISLIHSVLFGDTEAFRNLSELEIDIIESVYNNNTDYFESAQYMEYHSLRGIHIEINSKGWIINNYLDYQYVGNSPLSDYDILGNCSWSECNTGQPCNFSGYRQNRGVCRWSTINFGPNRGVRQCQCEAFCVY